MCEQVNKFKHWCGNCQIRIYIQRHEGRILTWQDCPYTCEYATTMRCSINPLDTAVMQVGEEHEMDGTAETVGREKMTNLLAFLFGLAVMGLCWYSWWVNR